MKVEVGRFGLPLLARELAEQAARRRTYLLRTVYACLLFGLAYVRFHDILGYQDAGGFGALGHGRRMFHELVGLQFAGIYLFMPALGCSAIAQEKERGTLALLLLTRLGPWTILFEKLLSRLAPMFVCLLLSMPLLAFTYSLGNVTQLQLWGSIWVLALTAVQVASLTLLCSAYCRTTLSAFISSYVAALGSLLFCGCCGLTLGSEGVDNMGFLVVNTFLLMTSTAVFLMLARSFLVSREFVAETDGMIESFRQLERFRVDVDETTGEIHFVRHVHSLPANDPIAWRETTKSPLGSTGYLVRVALSIEIPLILLLMLSLHADPHNGRLFAAIVLLLIWVVVILIIVIKTTGLISRERDRQTLETLLVAPIEGREILLGKLATVKRLLPVLWIPFGTVLLFRPWLSVSMRAGSGFSAADGISALCMVLSVLVYLPLVVWISLWIGLKVRSQERAILMSLVVMFTSIFLPLFLWPKVPEVMFWSLLPLTLLASPATVVQLTELGDISLWAVILNFLFYGALLYAIRRRCLRRADLYLGRMEAGTDAG